MGRGEWSSACVQARQRCTVRGCSPHTAAKDPTPTLPLPITRGPPAALAALPHTPCAARSRAWPPRRRGWWRRSRAGTPEPAASAPWPSPARSPQPPPRSVGPRARAPCSNDCIGQRCEAWLRGQAALCLYHAQLQFPVPSRKALLGPKPRRHQAARGQGVSAGPGQCRCSGGGRTC